MWKQKQKQNHIVQLNSIFLPSPRKKKHEEKERRCICVTNCSIFDTNHWLCAMIFGSLHVSSVYQLINMITCRVHNMYDLMLPIISERVCVCQCLCSSVHNLTVHIIDGVALTNVCKYVGCSLTLFLTRTFITYFLVNLFDIQRAHESQGTQKSRIRKFRVNWIDSSRKFNAPNSYIKNSIYGGREREREWWFFTPLPLTEFFDNSILKLSKGRKEAASIWKIPLFLVWNRRINLLFIFLNFYIVYIDFNGGKKRWREIQIKTVCASMRERVSGRDDKTVNEMFRCSKSI